MIKMIEKFKIGDKFTNTRGLQFEIIEYIKNNDVTVRFEKSGYTRKTTARLAISGSIEDTSTFPKVGEIYKNTFGTEFQIVAYNEARDVRIVFLDEFRHERSTKTIYVRNGIVDNPFDKTVFGIGYFGIGNYVGRVGRKSTRHYTAWGAMFNRCYSEVSVMNKSYKDSNVLSEFHCFQDFAFWAENQIGFENSGWNLDKDIIKKGNKNYGPDICAFVPPEVNSLLISCRASRGLLPVGVVPSGKKYMAKVWVEGKIKHLGTFETQEEAFIAYKQEKEGYIKVVAERWKDQVDPRVYNSLISWSISITD